MARSVGSVVYLVGRSVGHNFQKGGEFDFHAPIGALVLLAFSTASFILETFQNYLILPSFCNRSLAECLVLLGGMPCFDTFIANNYFNYFECL